MIRYLSFYFFFKPRILELDRCELLLPESTEVRVALPVLFLPTSYIQLFLSVVPSSYWAWLSSCLCFSPKHADALRFPDHNKHFSVVPSLLFVADGFLAIPLGMVDKRSQRNIFGAPCRKSQIEIRYVEVFSRSVLNTLSI